MARAGLNKFHVQQARDALRARGINPSVDAIRIELGNTGSKTTIHRYVRELEEAESSRLDDEALLSATLKEMIGRLATALHKEANQIVVQAKDTFQAEKATLIDQVRALQLKNTEITEAKMDLGRALEAERTDHAATKEILQNTLIKAERLEQQVSGLGEQLTENQKHLASLEEKHKNARDALEHFRTAAKEQREQEARRHENQIQSMQAELRLANQTLVVKQTEITQLNRDNAQFVSDLSTARKQLKQQANAHQELTFKLTQAETQINQHKVSVEDYGQLKEKFAALLSENETNKTQIRSLEFNLFAVQTELKVKDELLGKMTGQIASEQHRP